MIKRFFQNRLFPGKADRSLLQIIVFAQAIGLLGAVPGYLSIQANIVLNGRQVQLLSNTIPFLYLLGFLILLYFCRRITPHARKRLDAYAAKSLISDPDEEIKAWHEVASFPLRYGLGAMLVSFVLIIIPAFLISASQANDLYSPFQSFSLPSPIFIYIILGGVASTLGSVILTVLLLDRFTIPLRTILLPTGFEIQRKGRSGLLLTEKIPAFILAMLTVGVLVIAPIGFRQTIAGQSGEPISPGLVSEIRSQSILFSLLILGLGTIYSYYFARSVSDPVKELIASFDEIHAGNLSVRCPVVATDELGVVTLQFNRMATRLEELQNSLQQKIDERTRQLANTYEVGRAASSSLDPKELLSRVINLFTEQFGYYHAAIYLLDPSDKWAELREASGESAILLKQNHHRLEVSGESVVAAAIREKSARIAQIASEEKQRLDNPLLPRTRSEIALPLVAVDRVQGVLNVQSLRESDFGPDMIDTMQKMAAQVAIALDNARLFQEAQHNLQEMQTIQQQYLRSGWTGFSESEETLEYGVGDESDELSNRIDVAITLRDQVLGQIRLESNKKWTPEKESFVNAVATQAAIALENARLISESRQIAVRERMLTEINSKIWSSATIDGVLQTAVKELGRRLEATRASIELNLDDSQ
jgi:GAF domain-containing protein/HAMP domain-containing protein